MEKRQTHQQQSTRKAASSQPAAAAVAETKKEKNPKEEDEKKIQTKKKKSPCTTFFPSSFRRCDDAGLDRLLGVSLLRGLEVLQDLACGKVIFYLREKRSRERNRREE